MNKLFLISAILACSALQAANALELTFSPVTQSVAVGDTVSVNAVLSGLQSAGEILSAFDVSVNFNSSVLGFSSGVLGTDFGALSAFLSPSVSSSTISWNLTSTEVDATLQSIQGDSVTLGTFVFNALNVGSSPLTYSYSDLTGLNSQALSYNSVDGNITVTGPGSVPKPTSLMLLGIGAFSMLGAKRRKGQAARLDLSARTV